jgi:hypothetical protein
VIPLREHRTGRQPGSRTGTHHGAGAVAWDPNARSPAAQETTGEPPPRSGRPEPEGGSLGGEVVS